MIEKTQLRKEIENMTSDVCKRLDPKVKPFVLRRLSISLKVTLEKKEDNE